MGKKITVTKSKNTATITIKGGFCFELHSEFRDAYESIKSTKSDKIYINLRQTKNIDSSALGMLFLLHETVGDDADLEIINAKGEILSILRMTQLGKIFKIEGY